MRRVVVIGAGASGMTAALTAAADPENAVLLLERQARAGRKLMATGNGRCNLSNTAASVRHYHGEAPDFVIPALAAFPPAAALDFFHGLGLLTVTEADGRVYPLSNSANSVSDVLRLALEAAGVTLAGGRPARTLARRGGGFSVGTDTGEEPADAVIVAAGGAAGEKLGGGTDGYTLLLSLGHTRTALRPALVQLVTDSPYPRALKGIKADAALRLERAGRLPARSEGEVLFTDSGVSGPAAFDLSRAASEAAGADGVTLHMNLLRAYAPAEVLAFLRARRAALPNLPASDLLTGALHNRLGRMVVKYAGADGAAPLSALPDETLRRVAGACGDFALPVRGTEGFQNAQVTAGGVRTREFDPETLESRLAPNLFACGEVLDVDGDCGGFNLQWAWASGRLAGRLGK